MGIDIGTGTSKGVIIKDGEPVACYLLPSGINYKIAANKLAVELLKKAGISLDSIRYTVATGQGSSSVTYSQQSISYLRCCARGIFRLFPESRTIIDVEGQITQVMRLGNNWQLANFITS